MDEDKSNNMGENAGDSGPEPAETPPDSGSVITPGDSDSTTAPEPATPIVGKSGGGKKKPLTILLIVLLLAAAGAAAYFLYFNKSDDSTQSTENTEETSQFVPSIFVQNGTKVQYLDENQDLQDFGTLEEDDYIIEAANTDNGTVVRFANSNDETGELNSYGELTSEGRKQLVEFPDDVYSFPEIVISPDGSHVAAEINNDGIEVQEYATFSTQDGSKKNSYAVTASESGKAPIMVDWPEADKILLQEVSCRNCDGPRLPVLQQLKISTGEFSEFYAGDSAKLGYAEFTPSLDSSRIFVKGGDSDSVFNGGVTSEFSPDYIFDISSSDGTAKQLAEIKDSYNNIVGEEVGTGNIYVSIAKYVEGDDDISTLDVPVLNTLSSSGKLSSIPIETKHVTSNSNYSYVASYDGGIIFLVTPRDPAVDNTYSLLKLPLGEGESEITSLLEVKSDEFDIINMIVAQ